MEKEGRCFQSQQMEKKRVSESRSVCPLVSTVVRAMEAASAASATKDYYDILGVSKDAEYEEIKKGYHRQVLSLHPDKQLEDESNDMVGRLQDVLEAWSILGDPKKKAIYDAKCEGINQFNVYSKVRIYLLTCFFSLD